MSPYAGLDRQLCRPGTSALASSSSRVSAFLLRSPVGSEPLPLRTEHHHRSAAHHPRRHRHARWHHVWVESRLQADGRGSSYAAEPSVPLSNLVRARTSSRRSSPSLSRTSYKHTSSARPSDGVTTAGPSLATNSPCTRSISHVQALCRKTQFAIPPTAFDKYERVIQHSHQLLAMTRHYFNTLRYPKLPNCLPDARPGLFSGLTTLRDIVVHPFLFLI